jgi:hypothetical protein
MQSMLIELDDTITPRGAAAASPAARAARE